MASSAIVFAVPVTFLVAFLVALSAIVLAVPVTFLVAFLVASSTIVFAVPVTLLAVSWWRRPLSSSHLLGCFLGGVVRYRLRGASDLLGCFLGGVVRYRLLIVNLQKSQKKKTTCGNVFVDRSPTL